jgi:hypothetical protein
MTGGSTACVAVTAKKAAVLGGAGAAPGRAAVVDFAAFQHAAAKLLQQQRGR